MHNNVNHSIIPFFAGGAVNIYYFPNSIKGTGFATMELIEPDGSGSLPSSIGTYEFVGFTKYNINEASDVTAFQKIEHRLRGVFTILGNYSYENILNTLETIEIPFDKNEDNSCVILDEYKVPGVDFKIGEERHGLMLIILVFKSEMDYAMQYGSSIVIQKLKESGFYPYSDLDRKPVF